MASKMIEIADAVKTLLTSQVTSAGGTITRPTDYVPRYDLPDLGSLVVTVVPRSQQRSREARRISRRDNVIDVGILKRVPAGDADSLVEFAENVATTLETTEIAVSGATFFGLEVALFEAEDMDERQLFLAVVSPTYRIGVTL